jgi:membrane associated rhomboid family serine protease
VKRACAKGWDEVFFVVESSKKEYPGRPNVCRNCGALVGAGEPECAQCGAPLTSSATQRDALQSRYDREAMRFARAILTRPATFTVVFIVVNVFVFLLTLFAAGGANDDARFNAILIAYGAKVNYLIQQGQWWRFVTPIFLHGGFVHLLMNMYGLWILGPYVERLYGSAKFVVFWVLTGIAGVVASYLTVRPAMHAAGPIGRFLFKAEDMASVGASGALFGLIGVLFVFGIKFRHELPEGFKRAFGTGMLPTILLNIFIGYAFPFIDNAAHMGGLMAGALLALFVGYKRPHERAGIATFWHILQVAALALVLVSFLMVWRNYSGPPLDLNNASVPQLVPGQGAADFASNLNAVNAAQTAFVKAINKGDSGDVDRAIEGLDGAPRLDDETDALRNEIKSLLVRVKEYNALAQPSPPRRQQELVRAREQQKLYADFVAWNKRYQEWAETDSKKYGAKLKEPEPANDNSSQGK